MDDELTVDDMIDGLDLLEDEELDKLRGAIDEEIKDRSADDELFETDEEDEDEEEE